MCEQATKSDDNTFPSSSIFDIYSAPIYLCHQIYIAYNYTFLRVFILTCKYLLYSGLSPKFYTVKEV